MNDMSVGFYFVGAEPERTPLEELEQLTDELNRCPEKLKELRERERQIFDSKIYLRNGDHFEEAVLLKRTVKAVHVMLPSGTKHCLPGSCLEEKGKYTRHTKTMDREFYCGWRARAYLLSKIEATEKRYAKLKRLIPDLVRSIRGSGGTIPKETVLSLAPHYRSVK